MVGHNVSFDRAHIREQYLIQVRCWHDGLGALVWDRSACSRTRVVTGQMPCPVCGMLELSMGLCRLWAMKPGFTSCLSHR